MTQYVYILSEYEEDGAEHVCATLDRERVCELFETRWPMRDSGDVWKNEAREKLAKLLAKPDEELVTANNGHDLNWQWGGWQLHVVELRGDGMRSIKHRLPVMDYELAQLRHAYAQLVAGEVVNQREFAEGLLGPVIERLESIQLRITGDKGQR